ncbi:unnamed protein product [Peronospora belbahrii]|uniref:Uncharacterized protein n=1 Tax=Peronospora belbahrii TaxID=622444 RepID=A0AAU9L409_9STRA|nr:unnamed protein product [Peronospora belbahrii]CAH0521381.1 unnamed protein product [Peronospora belbahrii]
MPLLSYEGIEVDLPINLKGIYFEFTAGSLTIHCRDFTGDIVLSKLDQPIITTSSPSKKRTIDSSVDCKYNDDEADAKRLRPNFLNDVEQTLLLARLNDSLSSSSHEAESSRKMTKVLQKGDDIIETSTTHIKLADSAESLEPTSTKMEKKTPPMKSKKKAKNTKKDADSFFSPDPKQSISRKVTPDSSTKRQKTLKTRADPSSTQSIKELISGMPKLKPEAAIKWETVESKGNAPPERWGHSTTKISDERVVVYGGTDDDEQTLGDLHVFDMKTHRWTTPLNCETIRRTWHDAVFLSLKNLLLVFGGERNSAIEGEVDILSDIMVLDTECFLWYPPPCRGSPPSARSGHTCTAIGNEVVVFGGSGGRNRQSSVHILDSDDWHWKTVKVEGKAPSACTYHSAVAVGDDKIVYFGGNDSSKSFNEVHVLQKVDKSANDAVWKWLHPCTTGVPPQERTGHSATLLSGGKILIFGGWDPQRDDSNASTSVFSDSFLLDTKSWEWQPATFTDEGSIETALRGRVGHGAVMYSDGRVYIFGGQNGAEHRLDDVCTISILQG